ncbi:hypothetical protein [Acidisoma sp. 7E03]
MSNAFDITEIITEALQKHYGPMRCGRKIVARIAGASHRTADNWFSGRNAPKGPELIRLMAANEELTDEIMRMVQELKCHAR